MCPQKIYGLEQGIKRMKEVIVTGATGFIGRNIVPLLANLDYKIYLITRDKKFCNQLFKRLSVEVIEWDITNGAPKLNLQKSPALLHLAWEGLPNYNSLHHTEKNLISNYLFIKQFLNLGVSSLVITGTCLEYGMKSGILEVDDECNPTTPYGLAKHSLHRLLRFLQNEIDFNLAWARLFYTTGADQSPNSIIPQLDQAIARNDKQFNMSKGEQLRDYIPVKKIAEDLVTLLIERLNGTYNVCSGNPIAIRTLVENRIEERKSSISLNLGHYPYPKYEPMAFWGKPNIPKRKIPLDHKK